MRASSQRLALALAERIGAILPSRLIIQAEGGRLEVYAEGVSQGGCAAPLILDDPDDRTPSEGVETVIRAVLDGVQDSVSEYLTLPWPLDAHGRMTISGARVDAERAYLWYGSSEAAAVVTLRPIGFDEFTGG